MTPTGLVLSGGELLLGPEGVRVLRWAMTAAKRSLDRDGIALPPAAREVDALLAAVPHAGLTSACGSAAVPFGAGGAESALLDPVTTSEVARMLDCSARNARDLCDRGVFASARRTGGRWLVERTEVTERGAA